MTIASKLGLALYRRLRSRSEPEPATPQDDDEATVIIDRRFGIRLPGRRYYLDIRIGRERRHSARLASEDQRPLPLATLAYCGFGSAFFALFGFLCFAYLLKSMAGINLFERDSVLHPIYTRLFG